MMKCCLRPGALKLAPIWYLFEEYVSTEVGKAPGFIENRPMSADTHTFWNIETDEKTSST